MPQSKGDACDRYRQRRFIVTGEWRCTWMRNSYSASPTATPLPGAPPLPLVTSSRMHDKLIWNSPRLGAAQQKHPDAHQSHSRPAGLAGGHHENVEHVTTEKGLDVSDLNPKVKP